MSDDDHVFPQQILRGLGLLKTAHPSAVHPFRWHEDGGYWATAHGQPKPSVPPPGSSATAGEWVESIPYGKRIPASDFHDGLLLTGSAVWIWYPLPSGTAQQMNGQIWAMRSETPPTYAPTSDDNSWVTTTTGYWIWVHTKPISLLEAP